MQKKDQTEKTHPPAQQHLFLRNPARNNPQQGDSESSLHRRPHPLLTIWLVRPLARVEKTFRVHPWPCHEVSQRTPSAVGYATPGLPPCHPFEASKNGKGQGPHEQPGSHFIL